VRRGRGGGGGGGGGDHDGVVDGLSSCFHHVRLL
jgi:hypothetical protein